MHDSLRQCCTDCLFYEFARTLRYDTYIAVTLVPFSDSISIVSLADYGEVSVTLSFEECEERQCVGISVVDDLINEPVETLSLSLTANPELHLTLHPQTSEVAILDNDGKKSYIFIMTWSFSCSPYVRKCYIGSGTVDRSYMVFNSFFQMLFY